MATNHRHLYVAWLTCLAATVYVDSTRDRYSVCRLYQRALHTATVFVDSIRECYILLHTAIVYVVVDSIRECYILLHTATVYVHSIRDCYIVYAHSIRDRYILLQCM